MSELSAEEVAVLIRARQICQSRGLEGGADVKTICEIAGVSRKTGYQWVEKHQNAGKDAEDRLRQEHQMLKSAHEALLKQHADLRFENEGRKLAMEIHGVDPSKKKPMKSKSSVKQ